MTRTRFAAAVAALFRRRAAEVVVEDIGGGRGRPQPLGIEPLEERIAPTTVVINPPGDGPSTTVDLPDAAEPGAGEAIEHSPAVNSPPPTNPPIIR